MQRKKTMIWFAVVVSFYIMFIFLGKSINVNAATAKTVTKSGITYKVSSSKKKTAAVLRASKSMKKAKILATIKINNKTYKVTSVSQNAFSKCVKLKEVTIGKNIKTISSNAFSGDKNLAKITINTNSLTKIGNNAFKGIKKNATFYVPKAKYSKYQKLIKKKKTGWKSTMTIKTKSSAAHDDASQYSYSVTPLTNDVCFYFYVKTDNPDPQSFVFVDKNTQLSDSKQCYISYIDTEYADVNYTNKKTLRVNGGYIFGSGETDGGELKLEIIENGQHIATNKSVTIPRLRSANQYLIDTYTTSSMSFFEKMTAVEQGLNEICLYSGAYVLGNLNRSTDAPYYGLSTSPHVDQDFYIQNPYYRTNNKPMLVSHIYPYQLDSIGFPSKMARIAKILEPSATYEWDPYFHWLVDITYNGETRSYGGAGNGGGQGITSNLIKYKYSFTGAADDAYIKHSMSDIYKMINEYGSMTVPKEETDLPKLTWEDVGKTVGTSGGYVKLIVIDSIFGSDRYGYTFFYTEGNSNYPKHFSNVWYDGRYFNFHEYFEKGTTFDDEKASTASIVIKDAKIPLQQDPGKEYYRYDTKIDEMYDAVTGVWSGFTWYYYDKESNTWIASVYYELSCRDIETGEYSILEDEAFKEACTLTLDDVKAMSIDRNANVDPTSYYNYDMTVPPGTKVN